MKQSLVGQSLGRYQITEEIGAGGMAAVYKAYDTRLERNVAIKVIRKDYALAPDFLKRFEREAKALAHLEHPNIVKIHDFGEQDGMPFLVMNLLNGGSLSQKMGKPIPYQQAARLIHPIALALDFAHHRSIIHRDVKPGNILFTETNDPVLTDFGIAKLLGDEKSISITGTGYGVGTPDYMAPEQWAGQALPQSDIYALGIIYFELITGRRPFTGDTPITVLLKHANEPLPHPGQFVSDLPDFVEAVLFKALAKKPVERFGTMGAFADALEKFAVGGKPSIENGTQLMTQVMGRSMPTISPVSHPDIGEGRTQAATGTVLSPSGVMGTTPPPVFKPVTGTMPSPPSPPGSPGVQPPTPITAEKSSGINRWWIGAGIGIFVLGLFSVTMIAGLFLLPGLISKDVSSSPTFDPFVMITGTYEAKMTEAAARNPTKEATEPPAEKPMPTESPDERSTPLFVEPTIDVEEIPIVDVPSPQAPMKSKATVLWDVSHEPRIGSDGSYDPGGLFSTLRSLLEKNNVIIKTSSDNLNNVDLSQYDAVVIASTSAYRTPYSESEASKLKDYVAQGGGLIILAEDKNFPNHVASVAAQFGIEVARSTGLTTVGQRADHQLFNGVDTIRFYVGGGLSSSNPKAEEVAYIGSEAVIIALNQDPGRVVVVGDSNLFDNRWIKGNEIFGVNLFRWTSHLN